MYMGVIYTPPLMLKITKVYLVIKKYQLTLILFILKKR